MGAIMGLRFIGDHKPREIKDEQDSEGRPRRVGQGEDSILAFWEDRDWSLFPR